MTFNGLNGANNSGGSSPNVTLSNFSTGYGGYGGGPAGYYGLMSGGIYNDAGNSQPGNGSVFLNNLVAGHTYSVEYWVNDSRGLSRAVTLSTPGGNSATLSYDVSGYGQYAIGTFTANGPTAGFSVAGSSSDIQVNAVMVRDMTNFGAGYWSGNSGTWDQNTTPNFTTSVYTSSATFGTFAQATSAANTAYFGDYYYDSGSTVAVGATAVNVAAGGVSTGMVYFLNNAVNYSLTSSDSAGITGSTAVFLDGAGTVAFNGPNTHTGTTTINAGTLVLGHSAAMQNSTVAVNANNGLVFALGTTTPTLGGLSSNGGSFVLQDTGGNPVAMTVGSNGASTVFSGTMSGSGSVDKVGAGTLTLSAVNTFTGALAINGGEVILPGGNGQSWLTGNPNIFVNSGGTLAFSNYNSFGVNAASMPAVTVNPGGVILSSNTVVIYNNLTLNGGTVSINGNDNYGGTWGSLGFAGTTTATGNAAINVISGNGSIQIGSGNAGFGTFDVLTPAATDTLAVSAPMKSSLALVKQGNGTLLLGSLSAVTTSSSSFTGDITVSGGTLEVAAMSNSSGAPLGAFNSSRNINVNAGATLLFVAPNATAPGFSWNSEPTLNINGGTVTNAEPGGAFPAGKINNALSNVNLNDGVLTATTGQSGGYAAWNVNGTITSTGNSLISTSDPVYGTVMIAGGGGTTTINVASGTLTVSAPLVQDNPDNGVSGLNVAGAGLLVLATTNTYAGGTTISSGTVAVATTGLLGPGNVSILPGGVLDVSAFGSGGYPFSGGVLTAGRTASLGTDVNGSLNVQRATLDPAGIGPAATLTIDGGLALTSGSISYLVGDTIALAGPLSLSGTDYIVPAVSLSSGTYTLFTYNGGTPNIADLAMGGPNLSVRQHYAFSISGGTAVDLSISGVPGAIRWTGGSGVWYTGSSGAKNWYNTVSNSTDYFYAQDNVTFDDSAGSTNGNVAVNDAVVPGSVSVSNTAVSYVFSGSGSIGGIGALTKNGPGALTLATSNTYAGGTALNAGSLNINNAAALGSGSLTINGGTLDNTSGAAIAMTANNPQAWNADIVFNGTQSLNLGSGPVALGSNRTATVNASTLTVGGALSDGGNGYSLTKAGAGVLVLSGSPGYSGATTVNGGTLSFQDQIVPSTSITVNSNATLQYNVSGSQRQLATTIAGAGTLQKTGTGTLTFAFGSNPVNWNLGAGALIDVQAGTLVGGSYNQDNWAGNLASLNVASGATFDGVEADIVVDALSGGGRIISGWSNLGSVTFGVNNGSGTFSGVLGDSLGPGNFTKTGNGVQVLTGASTYTGATTISGGTLQFGTGQAGQDGSIIGNHGVTNNAALVYNLAGTQSVGYVVGGNGSVTKSGPGTLVFTAPQTYTGPTLISGGAVKLNVTTLSGFAGPAGWTVNSSGISSTPITGGTLTLTDNGGGESRSAFYNAPVPVNQPFTAQFVYTVTSNQGWWPMADGFCFTLQNQSRTALGGGGGDLGYGGISSSVSVGFENYWNPAVTHWSDNTSLNTGGTIGTYQQTDPINTYWDYGHPLQVVVSYDGSGDITQTWTDLNNNQTFSTTYTGVNIASLVGGNTAYVGFTGADGGAVSYQTISNFTFTPTPGVNYNVLPTTTALTVAASSTLDLAGGTQTIESLSGAGLVTNTASGALASLNVSGTDTTTFSGSIADGLGQTALALTGGTLTLSGTNSYTGGTTVAGGTLVLTSNEAIADGTSLTVGDPSSFAPAPIVAAPAASAVAPVPEPGTLTLLAMGTLIAVSIWRRKTHRT